MLVVESPSGTSLADPAGKDLVTAVTRLKRFSEESHPI